MAGIKIIFSYILPHYPIQTLHQPSLKKPILKKNYTLNLSSTQQIIEQINDMAIN